MSTWWEGAGLGVGMVAAAAFLARGSSSFASYRRVYDLIVEGGSRESDIDMREFFRVNDLDPEDVSAILDLDVGEEYSMGGGAAPIFRIKRVR